MEEMTNQSQDIENTTTSTNDDGSDLLLDDEDTPTDSTQEEESQSEAKENPITTAAFLKIKYNGAEQELSQEQAIELAQKGMNYDKVLQKLHNLENSQELTLLNSLAKGANTDVKTYLNSLQTFQNKAMIDNFAQQIKEKYPDAPDEMINEMAKNQFEKLTADKSREEITAKQTAEETRRKELIAQIDALEKEYPDVDVRNLPADVLELAENQGFTLLAAYKAHELAEVKKENESLKAEIEAAKKNNANAQKATGSLMKSDKEEDLDPFWLGFNS
ncbi:MAG: hypothetical protein J6K75_08935 [Erysipelotrichaceae bacterium]|nr:hypothetical protein [Erysipelotrichaceae bacterium]